MSGPLDLLVRREPTVQRTTFGSLFVGGQWQCHTLEDAIRERPGLPVSAWKVYGETAIPAGRYQVTVVNSPKFGPDTMTLHAVPGFDYIRIHAGNDDADTHGCLLVGTGRVVEAGDGGNLTGSRVALAALKTKVLAALRGGREVWITIENPPGGAA